ncbi:MAG: gfo/Idh/MocA family oxidoreductase, partial [Spirochaetia bacterium]
ADWEMMPARDDTGNAFKAQWELFLLHVAADGSFPWTLLEGAKGVQLAELGIRSWLERRWVDVPPLS